ncbi:MAG: hypothetical protein AAGG46_10005, partial [Planctomycetota bacterium]
MTPTAPEGAAVPRFASDATDEIGEGGQINVPPRRARALWKVILPGIRCPECGSEQTKAITGKRSNAEGLTEHY